MGGYNWAKGTLLNIAHYHPLLEELQQHTCLTTQYCAANHTWRRHKKQKPLIIHRWVSWLRYHLSQSETKYKSIIQKVGKKHSTRLLRETPSSRVSLQFLLDSAPGISVAPMEPETRNSSGHITAAWPHPHNFYFLWASYIYTAIKEHLMLIYFCFTGHI